MDLTEKAKVHLRTPTLHAQNIMPSPLYRMCHQFGLILTKLQNQNFQLLLFGSLAHNLADLKHFASI